ncbi:Aldehyde dehydrogenase [Phaffia rhodozyma]|uniref:Aldehyde dehydrogenase n=1 Tax=Phaffia rhodozyma TaxID=264483 RepID=A0A0F7SRE1_PHARH|nr:Aldehyde dehydrogenase [Phaffia rhodozyma]
MIHRLSQHAVALTLSAHTGRRLFAQSISLCNASAAEVKYAPLWVNNRPLLDTSGTFEVRHPASKQIATQASACDASQLSKIISSSRSGAKTWASTTAFQRRQILTRVAQLLHERKAIFRDAQAAETSATGLTQDVDFKLSINSIEEAAAITSQITGDIPQTVDGSLALVTREPFGTVFSISPFNMALILSIRAIVWPLACGNSVLLKGSPLIPYTHSLMGELFKDAGLPDGVLNIVQFDPDNVSSLVEQTIAHKDIKMVNFTGSPAVGSKIGSICGRYIKPAILELGGKAAAVVLEKADIEKAAHTILFGSSFHAGQTCMATERVIVVSSIYDDFVAVMKRKVTDLIKALKTDESEVAEMGLSGEGSAEKVKCLVKDALNKGATSLIEIHSLEKCHSSKAQPIVLEGVTSEMNVYFEESFGPLLSIIRANDADHAVEIANDSEFGLSSSVWTEDYRQAIQVAKALECSAVHINSNTVHDQGSLPHGGHKSSGYGRFNGKYAIDSFTQTKTITFRMNEPQAPFSLLK